MSLFDRLFGKKPTTQAAATPQPTPEPQPATKPKADASVSAPKPKPQQKDQAKPDPSAAVPATSNVPWRTFSIFISSTFADMQAERDHLKNVIFPRVEEELQKRRIKLEIVDLRWGVDTTSMAQEDEREANVLKVCLDEIRRCRPFFIGLLGDRYGWVPPLERMKTALAGEKHLVPEKGKSVTDLEIEFGVLASQEQLVRSVFYFRESLPYEMFSKRKAVLFSDEYNDELNDDEKKERKTALEKLKTNIRNHFNNKKLGNKVKPYSGIWDAEKEQITGLETWGDTIYTDILAECESHAKATWDKVPQNWQEQELALLDAFIETNTTTFCGRKPLLEELKQHLLTDNLSNWGLVLNGESGSGKSAVFSMVTKMMQGRKDCFILAHSAGLSPRAKSVADLLRIWNKQLADHLGIKEEFTDFAKTTDDPASRLTGEQGKETTTPIEKLQERFLELLQMASAKKRVVLLIDALDRFEPTARAQHMSWLPSVMPQNVRLLCTAMTGTEQKAVQYHKGLKAKSIDVFSTAEAKEMLDALCLRQHKSLPAKIEKIILEKKRTDGKSATISPLWLSLAVNMLMAIDHDDFEKMSQLEGRGDQQIENYLMVMANGFDPLPGPLFLSLTNKAGLLFGETFTAAVFNYLAISRNGLREKDLEKILPAANIAWDPLKFANLRRWFKAHLVLQGEELQWNLAHSILKNALLEKTTEPERKKVHLSVANHFLSLPDTDALKISETMYHLMQVEKREMAAYYYGSFWWNTPQTEGSSKVMAEALILNEALEGTESLNWMLSFLALVGNDKDKLRALLNNFISSLFDLHLQNDTTVNTRIKLINGVSEQMEELRRKAPDSADYARDLSVSYNKLGDMYLQLGDRAKALDKYQASLTIAEELRRRAPDSADYAYDLSVSYNKLGDMYLKLGDPAKALYKYQASLTIREKLHRRAPDSADYSHGLSVSYINLGDLYLKLCDLPKALDKYQASLTIAEELRRRAPESADYARDLSVSYDRLGDLYRKLGDPAKALDKYKASLTIREELRRRAPDSADYASSLSTSYDRLGDMYLKSGDPAKALDKYQASLTIREELRRRAPDSADYARDLATSYDRLGDLYLQSGDPVKALDKYQASLTIAEELCRRAPDSADYSQDLAISYDSLGDLYLKSGDPVKALVKYQASLTIREELRRRAPNSADYARVLSVSYNKLGDIHLQLGDTAKALEKYRASQTIREELRRRAPDSADYARDLFVSYYKTMYFQMKQGNQKEQNKYAKLCKDALLYMKNRGMYMDERLVQVLNQLQGI